MGLTSNTGQSSRVTVGAEEKSEILRNLGNVMWLGETRPVNPSVVRRDLQQLAEQALTNGKRIYITGLARTGKSTFAECLLQGKMGLRVDASYADQDFLIPEEYRSQPLKGYFYDKIFEFISTQESENEGQRLDSLSQNKCNYDSGAYATPIHYLNAWAQNKNFEVRLILDEVSKLALNDRFLSYLNDIIVDCANIQFGFILHHNGNRESIYSNRLSNCLKIIPEPLDIKETKILLNHYIGQVVDYDDEFVVRLHELTGGRPIEISQLLFEFATLRRDEALTDTGALSLEFLNKIAKGVDNNSSISYIRDTCHLANLSRLSSTELDALKYLTGLSFSTQADSSNLTTLQTLGLVERLEQGGWRIRGELLENNLKEYFCK